VKQSGSATYDQAQRTGVIVMPEGKELRVRDVSIGQFQKIVAKHDQRFGRASDARANSFTR
jgi:hypothetical protein